ncbi:MAG TPA: hypothetical protein VFH56_14445 [Acidimicrobiales bacterium]|nr:hypothetical protein [Acidimicrobiales bacterium]
MAKTKKPTSFLFDHSAPAHAAGGTGGDILAQAAAGLNGGALGGVGLTQQYTPDQIIHGLLASTAKEVQPTSGFQYGQDALPDWFPKELAPIANGGAIIDGTPVGPQDLQGVYDPYMGDLSMTGDERTFMGIDTRPVYVADMHDWTGSKAFTQKENVKQSEDVLHNKATVGNDTQSPIPDAQAHDENMAHFAPPPGTPKTESSDKTITTAQAMSLPYVWSDEKVREAMKKMRQAGLDVTSFHDMELEWRALVDRASKMYDLSQGQNKVTPWDVLELQKREAKAAGNFVNFQNGSETTTSRSVSDITQGESWRALQSTLSTLLGRDPTSQELRDYTYRMNQLAAQNPTLTTTVHHYVAGREKSQDSNTTGGFGADDLAQNAYQQAQDNPDYGAFQSATTYFNAAVSALGAIGGN